MSWAGGVSAAQSRQREAETRDAAETLTRCAFCPEWFHIGSASEGRERATEHRLEAHPEIRRSRRRRTSRSLLRFRSPEMHEEEVAEIEAERQKRARITGVDLGASSE